MCSRDSIEIRGANALRLALLQPERRRHLSPTGKLNAGRFQISPARRVAAYRTPLLAAGCHEET